MMWNELLTCLLLTSWQEWELHEGRDFGLSYETPGSNEVCKSEEEARKMKAKAAAVEGALLPLVI